MGMREKGEISDYTAVDVCWRLFVFFFFNVNTLMYYLVYFTIPSYRFREKISEILFFIGDILSRANFVFLRNGSNVTESRIYSSRDDQQLHEKSS